jgi:1,2-diacylglycerol 3-alpha-glucosyltransferase
MSLRILFITNNYTPYRGGVVHAINAAVDCLQKAGHRVQIVTLDFGTESATPEHFDVVRLWCPITFQLYQNPMAIPFLATWHIAKIVSTFKPDIIHTHHPFLLGNAALRAAHTRNIPIVFTYHTLYETYAHYVPLPKIVVQSCTRYAVQFYCSQVTYVIAPSTIVHDHIQAETPGIPIRILPSPIDDRFCPAQRSKDSVRIKLLVVSRFVPEKNLLCLFDLLLLLPTHYHLTLVGYGYFYDTLVARAHELGHTRAGRVHFVLQPTPEALVKLYQQADLFVFPSHVDTQGLVLAEAMACGTPVIALDGPGQRDIIADGENGFIVDSIKEMAHTIEKSIKNKILYQHLVHGAIATAQRYHKSSYAQALVALYQESMR